MTYLFLNFLVSACICGIVLMFSSKIAYRAGLVDIPGGRKQHETSTPLIGGVAILLATTISSSLLKTHELTPLLWLVVLLGLLDDRFELSAITKLCGQVAVAISIIVVTGIRVESIGTMPNGSELHLGHFGLIFSVFAIVGLINAFNMIDGIDGLASGLTMVALTNLIIAMNLTNLSISPSDQGFISAIFGALIVFFFFNLSAPPRKVFLGDSGSMLLGLCLAFFLIKFSQNNNPNLSLSASIVPWLVAIPICDTCRLIFTRLKRGSSPLASDREHIHHMIMDKKVGQRFTLYMLLLCSLFLFWFGYMISSIDNFLGGFIFIVVLIVYSVSTKKFVSIN